jgi:FtsZ-binding cell division protein ZapB
MKKAFEQNVSRTRPRVKLGTLVGEPPTPEEPDARPAAADVAPPAPAAEAKAPSPRAPEPRASASPGKRGAEAVAQLLARHEAPASRPAVAAQPPSAPRAAAEPDPATRREKLRQRLKAAREQPRPEPLPATAAAAGVLAVERISVLQAELIALKAHNQGLAQELETARRQSERATEEARVRVDEARRLAAEVEGRTKLLADLERELAALEGERDETLLAVQELRSREGASAEERGRLEALVAERDRQISDGLAEEERLASEVESYREELDAHRRTVAALTGEREMLVHQVAELTAERQELVEARKALEAVHRALTDATAR